jgi:hypothetical protein
MSHHFIVRSRTHLVSLHVPCNLIARVPLPLRKYPKALYLFTRSDLKTIILPTVCLRLHPNPPHIDLSIDRFCLSLSPRPDCGPYTVRSVMDVVAPSSNLRLESESESRGRCIE